MDAREYFETVRDAARRIDAIGRRKDELLANVGPRGMSFDAHGHGIGDPMARVDDLVDWETRQVAELGECRRAVGDGWAVVAGIEERLGDDAAQVVTRRALWCEGWQRIAREMGHGQDECRLLYDTTMDWCDYLGIARLREIGSSSL